MPGTWKTLDRARNYTSCHVVSAWVGSVNQAKGLKDDAMKLPDS